MIEHILLPLVCERFKHDAHYRDGHLRVVNALPCRKVLGLHTPEMKSLAKQLSRSGCVVVMPDGEKRSCNNAAELIRQFEDIPSSLLSYEETVIWGFLINHEKCDVASRFAMLSKYVPVMDNWAVCDAFCANAKWLATVDKEQLWAFLQPWFASRREFEVRFAVVVSMCYLLSDEWLNRVFKKIETIDFNNIVSYYSTIKGKPERAQQGTVMGAAPYYVRMGVAWLLATALAKFPLQTRSFVRGAKLPTDVIRLYVRKARESLRTRTVEAL